MEEQKTQKFVEISLRIFTAFFLAVVWFNFVICLIVLLNFSSNANTFILNSGFSHNQTEMLCLVDLSINVIIFGGVMVDADDSY